MKEEDIEKCVVGYKNDYCDECFAPTWTAAHKKHMESLKQKETVNHPNHYLKDSGFEVIDVIEAWGLDFSAGNALKYLARHKHKGKPVEDLKKALWYIQRLIDNYEKKPKGE